MRDWEFTYGLKWPGMKFTKGGICPGRKWPDRILPGENFADGNWPDTTYDMCGFIYFPW